MAQNTRVAGSGTSHAGSGESPAESGTSRRLALLAVLGGGAVAAALDAAENYGFVHLVPANLALVALSYLLVGLVTAAPVMVIRRVTAAVAISAALLAVLAFIGGDMTYVLISSLSHHVSFDFFDYMRSYGEFQKPATIRLEVLAPVTAGLLAGLRLRRLKAAAHPPGRHEARANQPVPPPDRPLSAALNHAEVD